MRARIKNCCNVFLWGIWKKFAREIAFQNSSATSLSIGTINVPIPFLEHLMTINKRGFTLIELLIVVVIIGILAAIAIPKFASTKDKAYVAAMKSDLRNLATYEEQYAADNQGAYFGGTATMASPLNGFSPSQNVTITVTSIPGPPPSWSANAVHSQSAKTCDSNVTAQ